MPFSVAVARWSLKPKVVVQLRPRAANIVSYLDSWFAPTDLYGIIFKSKSGKDENLNSMQFNTQADLDNYNNNLVETNVRLMGDKTVVGQVVQLLSYIRHAIRNNLKTTIEVDIANTVANVPFMLDANGMEVPDLVTVKKVQVN